MPFIILIFASVFEALSRFRAFWFICALQLSTFLFFSLVWGLLFGVWTILTVFLMYEIAFFSLLNSFLCAF